MMSDAQRSKPEESSSLSMNITLAAFILEQAMTSSELFTLCGKCAFPVQLLEWWGRQDSNL